MLLIIAQDRVGHALLGTLAEEGLFQAISRGVFADVKRPETGGRGLEGVVPRSADYLNPLLEELEATDR